MSGQLRPGEFIRLDAVAQQLGVSVTPVREALVLLRAEGMVRLIPRRGYVVAPLSRQDVDDLFEMQVYIGAEIVARAVKRIDTETLETLAAENRQLQAAIRAKDSTALMQHEYEFHRVLNGAAESRKLAYMLNNATRYLPRGFYAADAQWRNAAAGDHKRILDALRAGDVEAAQAAVASHVRDGKVRLLEHLDSIAFWA